MKYRTTQKAVKDGYVSVIEVGYCNLQYLLNCETPVSYTCNRDGWCADIYDFGSMAIVTGYNPFGNITPSYELCKEYDDKAEELYNNREMRFDFRLRKAELNKLIEQFIKAAHDERWQEKLKKEEKKAKKAKKAKKVR